MTPQELFTHGFVDPATESRELLHSGARASLVRSTAALDLPGELLIDGLLASTGPQPITVGLPFPRGALQEPHSIGLRHPDGRPALLQRRRLASWPDGSVRWLLLDFIADPAHDSDSPWAFEPRACDDAAPPSAPLRIVRLDDGYAVETGTASFRFTRRAFPLAGARVGGTEVLDPAATQMRLVDRNGRSLAPRIDRLVVEESGPVRLTLLAEGGFGRRSPLRFESRVCLFARTGLVRVRLTLRNPRRACHTGGLWDLGDRGSCFFRELSFSIGLDGGPVEGFRWQAEESAPPRWSEPGNIAIYQDSSGGECWQSRNHADHRGRVPCRFRGYLTEADGREERGLRASPILGTVAAGATLGSAIPEFWQQFPKAVGVEDRTHRLALFPGEFAGGFELQGGEQKTHTCWLHFGPPGSDPIAALGWVHRPARARIDPDWYARSGAVPHLIGPTITPAERTEALLEGSLDGEQSLVARREIIDEYGWRNYGEVYADHENAFADGPKPVVSHYNNQYDMTLGFAVHGLRTGDRRWLELSDALARHVVDIDIYHTDRDRAAYNGGLFWHTDHYRDAATCTHRTYSRANRPAGSRAYGGGPGNEHNYTTGLLLHHYRTGDPLSRRAVIGLADWVLAMEDGSRNLLGLVDDGPTGLSTRGHRDDYHGPGRGSGNSVNALLDAWTLTGSGHYLAAAEGLIRRVVHPEQDIDALGLLEAESQWSYTVFLSALARYLHLKAEAGHLDAMYAYASACLSHFGRWMAAHEVPYLDHPEALEFVTETWAAQDLRKANVLRLASAHVDPPHRSACLRRADELADRAWSDLNGFESRQVARSIALVMIEGWRDEQLRLRPPVPAVRVSAPAGFGSPARFVPQKRRVLDRLRTPGGLIRTALALADPRSWARYLGRGGFLRILGRLG